MIKVQIEFMQSLKMEQLVLVQHKILVTLNLEQKNLYKENKSIVFIKIQKHK